MSVPVRSFPNEIVTQRLFVFIRRKRRKHWQCWWLSANGANCRRAARPGRQSDDDQKRCTACRQDDVKSGHPNAPPTRLVLVQYAANELTPASNATTTAAAETDGVEQQQQQQTSAATGGIDRIEQQQ